MSLTVSPGFNCRRPGAPIACALAVLVILSAACRDVHVAGHPMCHDSDDCRGGLVCVDRVCLDPRSLPDAGDAFAAETSAADVVPAPAPDSADDETLAPSCTPACCSALAPPSPCWEFFCDPEEGRCRARPLPDGALCGELDDPCRAPRCRQSICAIEFAPDDTPCEDFWPCTRGDRCLGGTCRPGPHPTCDDLDPCTANECDPASGECRHPPLPDGGACDDGDPCTLTGACLDGQCHAPPVECDDGDPCTHSRCLPRSGDCVHDPKPDGTACDDLDPCTEAGRCVDGDCRGVPIPCDDLNPCTANLCEHGECSHPPLDEWSPCDSPDPCASDGVCRAGVCRGRPIEGCCESRLDCPDSDPCVVASCHAEAGRCLYTPKPCGGALDGCEAFRCGQGGACEVVSLEEPAALWRVDFGECDESLPATTRPWPPEVFSLCHESGRDSGCALTAATGAGATLHFPPRVLPSGPVTLKFSLSAAPTSCPEGELLAVVWPTDEGGARNSAQPLTTVLCPPDSAPLHRSVALPDLRSPFQARLDIAPEREISVFELALIHEGGCH